MQFQGEINVIVADRRVITPVNVDKVNQSSWLHMMITLKRRINWKMMCMEKKTNKKSSPIKMKEYYYEILAMQPKRGRIG